ncbi:hypothetical protein EVAR_60664_1 [Eumeta japonica]|uniref:Uncharacterized protein n=1 Tax=Eumeta variegata TaxID=151549 RepID=A0A4C1ZVU5_EUMVA|nr:hypothetical protein EVAR_60664_1 [Eumeta japonica]
MAASVYGKPHKMEREGPRNSAAPTSSVKLSYTVIVMRHRATIGTFVELELRGRRFVDDNQMKMAVKSHFDCKEREYFLGGLKALYTICEK